jgi:hypothetical protein
MSDYSIDEAILGKLARPERLELPTFCFVGRRSIQLSYGRAACNAIIV